MRRVVAIVRNGRKGLPRAGEKSMTGLTASERQLVAQLAGILRVADAFDRDHDSRIRRLRVTVDKNLADKNLPIIVEAEGYSPRDRMAQDLTGARYLLEMVYRRPILVKTWRVPKAMGNKEVHKKTVRAKTARKTVFARLRAA
ncbi:MAG: hypothetical protein ABSE92_09665 [Terriglobales bacterium]